MYSKMNGKFQNSEGEMLCESQHFHWVSCVFTDHWISLITYVSLEGEWDIMAFTMTRFVEILGQNTSISHDGDGGILVRKDNVQSGLPPQSKS